MRWAGGKKTATALIPRRGKKRAGGCSYRLEAYRRSLPAPRWQALGLGGIGGVLRWFVPLAAFFSRPPAEL